MIYNSENSYELFAYFDKFDKAIFFGKGQSFKNRPKEKGEIYLAGNNAVNHLSQCDILMMNDYIATELIYDESYEIIDYIIIPEKPHYTNGKPHKDITYMSMIENIGDKFKGDYIIINLPTNKNYTYFFNTQTCASVINTGIDFIGDYTNIKKIETYGFALNGYYCDEIINSNTKFCDTVYEQKWINMLRKTYEKQINWYNLKGEIK